MININPIYEEMFNSAARQFVGRVELLEGSTLLDIFEHDGALISFTIDRTSDNTKFFGYGISQYLTMRLRDKDRSINIQKGQYLQAAYGIGTDYVYNCTMFIVDEVTRDEKTNELTVKALDPIYTASGHMVSELELPDTYTLRAFAIACGSLLGMPVNFVNIPDILLDVEYTKENTNFNGDETIRSALSSLAEMFGAIYYFCNNWQITFKRVDIEGDPVLLIDKSKYFELSAKTAVTLTNLMSVTELGDNVGTVSNLPGETQYLRENPFLTLRGEEVAVLLENILTAVQGITLQQFSCKHRGDFRLEIGDKIGLTTKDDQIVTSYYLTDSTTFNGGLVSETLWTYSENVNETESNPTTLGDALKMTYAKVDKVNQEIELLAKKIEQTDVGQLTEEIAGIKVTTDSISAHVSELEKSIDDVGAEIESVEQRVDATLTSENLNILISNSLSTMGNTSVKTSTGFTFDADGLKIEKTNAATKTRITENGMKIYDVNDAEVLTVDNTGVNAKDLHASTFLSIGNRSRFENYGTRTGCFWIGG